MRLRNSKTGVLSKTAVVGLVAVVQCLLFFSVPSLAKPWAEHIGRLSNFTKQIETKEEEIRALITAKSETHDHKHVAELIRAISEAHKSLEEISKEYEEEREHVRFEHPERNDDLERRYVRHRVRTIGEMESEFGIDGRLDRLKARVLATFPLPEQTPAPRPERTLIRTPASTVSDDDVPEKIHLKR